MIVCTECGRELEEYEEESIKYHICEDCLIEIE